MRKSYLQVLRGLASFIVFLEHVFATPSFFHYALSHISHSSLASFADDNNRIDIFFTGIYYSELIVTARFSRMDIY
ncbi:hypothetical protein EAM_0129 [Erwinia amylovora ATCC 49946]|nr:hypothetical protein EAM_0129 [Erwinia amylovora ATCC 49946]